MENGRSNSSFWNFSDQLRLHTAGIGSLSLGESIWSDPFLSSSSRKLEDRRNIESSVDAEGIQIGASNMWKSGLDLPQKVAFSNSNLNRYNNSSDVGSVKSYGKAIGGGFGGVKKGFSGNNEISGKSGKNKKISSGGNKEISGNNGGNCVDKRFKTLPASEALPRTQTVGGYIFVCNNETMEENLKRQLFGLPPRYRDSVRVITPGLPVFLYNYSTHQLHGIFEAASFGGTNIDPTAWEDKKHPGESRYPAQVKVLTRKNFEPLEEDSFRPILHHYDGPKFRLELSVPEAVALLDVFAENAA